MQFHKAVCRAFVTGIHCMPFLSPNQCWKHSLDLIFSATTNRLLREGMSALCVNDNDSVHGVLTLLCCLLIGSWCLTTASHWQSSCGKRPIQQWHFILPLCFWFTFTHSAWYMRPVAAFHQSLRSSSRICQLNIITHCFEAKVWCSQSCESFVLSKVVKAIILSSTCTILWWIISPFVIFVVLCTWSGCHLQFFFQLQFFYVYWWL